MKQQIAPSEVRDFAESTCEVPVDDPTPQPVPRVKRRSRGEPANEGAADGASEASASALPLAKFDRIDQVYQDFCRRREQGESVDPDAYCAQFPSMKSALARLVHAQVFFEEHSILFAEMPEVRWPEAGETYHDYELKLVLGKGAFARVFLATEPKLGSRLVALKIALHGAAEADVLGRIHHPNIVPVHSVQEDKPSGLSTVCMPYVGSATLHDLLDLAFTSAAGSATRPTLARVILDAAQELPYPLDPSAHRNIPAAILQTGTYVDGVRLIGAQLAEALAYLHANGIYHRDLKPSNVLLSPTGVPLLLDFNLCADSRRALNQLGGTMPYMSPEQLRAADAAESGDSLDARSDIFSLGVILYQLATGVHPFGPIPLKLPSAQLRRHMLERQHAGAVEAQRVNPNVDASLSRLIQRCLALEPNDRPQSAAEIAFALRGALTPLPRAKRWLTRHPLKSAAAVLLLALVGLGSIGLAAFRPPYSERQLDSGMRHYQEGRYAQAVQHFNDTLQSDPNNSKARLARAHAHQQLGDYNLAMQDYLEADKRHPDGRVKAALGYCLNRSKGQPEAAIHVYEQAIQAGFATAEVHNNLGFTYMELGAKLPINPLKARENLDQALKLDPKLQAAYHNRAVLSLNQALTKTWGATAKGSEPYRSLESAIADALKAIELGSASADLHFDAATLCVLASKVDEKWKEPAVRHLENAVKHGLDSKKLTRGTFRPLEDQPGFQQLLKRPMGQPQPPTPTRRLADPILNSSR